MKLYYFKDDHGNFGDDLNAWLWETLLPGVWNDDRSISVSGIGTIISRSMPKADQWVVFGSGAGYEAPPEGFGGKGWDVLAVRGPLSAEVLGLPPEKAVTDGAILLSLLPEYAPVPESERAGIVFMPHHGALGKGNWKAVCEVAGIEYLDPRADARQTLERLRRARLVVADAMHAAIVADTVRVPWVPVATSMQINAFKWLDWTLSMELPYKPLKLRQSTRREALRSRFMGLRGQRYYVDDATRDTAMAHFRASCRMWGQKWWPVASLAANAAYGACQAALSLYEMIVPPATADKAWLAAAAEDMQRAARAQSYLSRDDVFARRKDQMAQRVERLRQYAAMSTAKSS